MPSFSHRRGLPSSRRNEEKRDRCRGRRPRNAATCRTRLMGWIRNVAERSPIWGDIDLKAFCAATGYSREHATRVLSKLRRECGLKFETKLRRKRGAKKKTWGVIVADPGKLRFDRRSLFYDQRGNRLHNYTTLANGGEKIMPTILLPASQRRPRGRPRTRPIIPEAQRRPRGRPRKQRADLSSVLAGEPQKALIPPASAQDFADSNVAKQFPKIPRHCDNPLRKDSYGIQQPDLYGAKRGVAPWRSREGRVAKPRGLQRKAFALQTRLSACHWDNCKVRFGRRAAHCYALRALGDGHEEWRIVSCYEQALFVCHGHAVDRTASSGTIIQFNVSSTIVKAAALLARDGLNRRERITRWYSNHPKQNVSPCLNQDERAFVHAQIAATFPHEDGSPVSHIHPVNAVVSGGLNNSASSSQLPRLEPTCLVKQVSPG